MVTPVAATIATPAGSQPARISGTTTLTTTESESARAIRDRTPRQPPTTVTAKANRPTSNASVGMRYRSLTATNPACGSVEMLMMTSSPTSKSGRASRPLGPCRKPSTTSPVFGPSAIPSTTRMRTSGVPGSVLGSSSRILPCTSWTGGRPDGRGAMSGTNTKIARTISNPPTSATALRRRPANGTASGRVVDTGEASGCRRCVFCAFRTLLERTEMGFDAGLERAPPEPDEDVGPAIERLERRGMDHPRPTGDRLQPPAHSLSNPEPVTRSRKRDSGRASRLSTRASSRSSPRRVLAVPRRRRGRPRRRRRPEPELREQRRGSPPGRGASPRRSAATPARRRVARPGVAAQVIAGTAKADLGVRTDGHRVRRRSGARPSSSRGRRRSIPVARRPDRRASRSAPR